MKTLYIILIVIIFLGCNKSPQYSREELIDKQLKLKIDKYHNNLMLKCYNKTLLEAHSYVDSLVSSEFSFADSLAYPSRPSRPQKPDLKNRNEVIKATPIFDR